MRKTFWAIAGVLGTTVVTAASIGPDTAISNLAEWATKLGLEQLPAWVKASGADRWALTVGGSLTGYAVAKFFSQPPTDIPGYLQPATEAPRIDEDDPARQRLVAFWRTCARDMLRDLAQYFETVRNGFQGTSGSEERLVQLLAKKYLARRTPRMIARLDALDQMTFDEQQTALADMWDLYKELCQWILVMEECRTTDKDNNEPYQSWRSRDPDFTTNFRSILADGGFPILVNRIGSVTTSDQFGPPP